MAPQNTSEKVLFFIHILGGHNFWNGTVINNLIESLFKKWSKREFLELSWGVVQGTSYFGLLEVGVIKCTGGHNFRNVAVKNFFTLFWFYNMRFQDGPPEHEWKKYCFSLIFWGATIFETGLWRTFMLHFDSTVWICKMAPQNTSEQSIVFHSYSGGAQFLKRGWK